MEVKMTEEELKKLEDLVEEYKEDVRKKVSLLMECIKLNSGNGNSAIRLAEATEWVDASQNLLCYLFVNLKALIPENQEIVNGFIEKIANNLQEIKKNETTA